MNLKEIVAQMAQEELGKRIEKIEFTGPTDCVILRKSPCHGNDRCDKITCKRNRVSPRNSVSRHTK